MNIVQQLDNLLKSYDCEQSHRPMICPSCLPQCITASQSDLLSPSAVLFREPRIRRVTCRTITSKLELPTNHYPPPTTHHCCVTLPARHISAFSAHFSLPHKGGAALLRRVCITGMVLQLAIATTAKFSVDHIPRLARLYAYNLRL